MRSGKVLETSTTCTCTLIPSPSILLAQLTLCFSSPWSSQSWLPDASCVEYREQHSPNIQTRNLRLCLFRVYIRERHLIWIGWSWTRPIKAGVMKPSPAHRSKSCFLCLVPLSALDVWLSRDPSPRDSSRWGQRSRNNLVIREPTVPETGRYYWPNPRL